MSRSTLRIGDEGAEVRRLQDLMNRTGTMLALDGDFGPATARAVARCRADANQPPSDSVDRSLREWLEAQPEPSDYISCEGVTFIAREEIGSFQNYERNLAKPEWPGAESGITIGVGYDLRFQGDDFEADWGECLDPTVVERLRPFLTMKGDRASVRALSDIHIPFSAAWHVYTRCTIPRFIATTRSSFPTLDQLPDLCRTALISLVFNRGGSLSANDSRREMREIRQALEAGEFELVPAMFESMARLWPGLRGLRERRFREAELWRRGLASA